MRTPTSELSPRDRKRDSIGLTLALLFIQALICAIAVGLSVSHELNVAGCASSAECNLQLGEAASVSNVLGPIVLLLAAIVFVAALRVRGRSTWFVPLIGTSATVIIVLVASVLYTIAYPASP